MLASDILPDALWRLQLLLFALRAGWYLVFLLRVEYRTADWRPAPALPPRARLAAALRSAPLHALLCLPPLALGLARGVLERTG